MIKRASTILLTLFLLLLGINTAFAAPSCSTTFSKTNLAPKTTGATYYELKDAAFSEGITTEMSASLKYVKNSTPKRGEYTVSGNKLSLGCVKTGSLLSITIPRLKANKTYSLSITASVRLRAQESDASEKHRTNFKLSVGSSSKQFENNKSDWSATGTCNMSMEFTPSSSSAIALLSTDNSGDCYILDITEIKIVGCYDPQIVSSAGDLIPKGYPCTFQAIGMNGPITWTFIDEHGVSQPLSGTGNTVTIDNVTSGGEIVAVGGGQTLRYAFAAIISCSEHADKQDVVNITFKMPGNSPCQLDQIQDDDVTSGKIRLSSKYCFGYYHPDCDCEKKGKPEQPNLPSGSGPQEEHYVIARSTQGMFPGWYKNEVVRGTSDNGFMIVNCGQQVFNQAEVERGNLDRGKICEFDIRLCDNTWYDFSAQVRDIDQEPGDIVPTNVRFVALGANNEILLNYSTGTIPESWTPKGQSFNTKNNTKIKLILYNNQEPNSTNCGIYGSDLGLDDIKFTRCIPKLGTFSDKNRTQQGDNICNDRNDVNVTLYSGHPQFGITDMINQPYYIFLKSKNGGKWSIVNTTPISDVTNGYAEQKDVIAKLANDNGSKYQYTSVVAGHPEIAKNMAEYLAGKTPSSYDSDRKNYKYTGSVTPGCNEDLYAFSEKTTTFTVVCTNPCVDSKAPEMKDYKECPTSEDKIELTTLIKSIKLVNGDLVDLTKISDAGTLSWYKQNPTDPTKFDAITETNVEFPTQGKKDTYQVRFTQKDGASQTYCISDATTFYVEIKGAIELSLVEDNIALCYNTEKEIDENRTFYTEITDETLTNITYKWTDKDGNTISGATGSSYTLPLETLGTGKITVIAEDNDKNLCASKPKVGTYEILKEPKLDITIDVPCKDKLVSDGIKLNFTNIASDTKSWFEIDRLSDASNKEYASLNHISPDLEQEQFDYKDEEKYVLTDKFVANENPTKVQYKILFANTFSDGSWCSFEKVLPNKDEYYDITDTNQFYLTSNAKDINEGNETATKAEYHACVGNEVKITSSYDLKAGEIYEWYVKIGDEDFVKDATEGSEDSKFFTIAAIEETTIVKVDIVDDPVVPGNETCGGSATITINVDEMPKIQSKDVYICENDEDGIQLSVTGGEKYKWSPTTGLSAADISNPIAKVSKTTTYTVDVYKGQCKNDTTVVVNVNDLPVITSIEPVSEEEKGNMVVTIVKEVGDTYSYSLDGENYAELPIDNIIKDLPIGWSLLYIKNDATTCVNSKEFYIAPIEIKPDKFFSPNEDGNNDKWEVEHLNSYDSYIVEIFDRHGKRLFIQRVGSFNIGGTNTVDGDEFEGWNGEYNGKPMPSDDYWYLITVEDIRKQYTGHFTLKR
jgi:gliding motility-associated-like protein